MPQFPVIHHINQASNSTHLLRLTISHRRFNPSQTFANKQDAIDQQSIGWTLDLEVAKESIGAEQCEDLVECIVALALRIDVEIGCSLWKWWERISGSTSTGAKREEGEVAWFEISRVNIKMRSLYEEELV